MGQCCSYRRTGVGMDVVVKDKVILHNGLTADTQKIYLTVFPAIDNCVVHDASVRTILDSDEFLKYHPERCYDIVFRRGARIVTQLVIIGNREKGGYMEVRM